MKLIVILMIVLLVFGFVGVKYHYLKKYVNKINSEIKSYQGPVPEGYNETHFRKTGETILENG